MISDILKSLPEEPKPTVVRAIACRARGPGFQIKKANFSLAVPEIAGLNKPSLRQNTLNSNLKGIVGN